MNLNPRVAVYPGTFDPITKGHVDIIERAAPLVDRLILLVAKNAGKGPIFSSEERLDMVKKEIETLDLPKPSNVQAQSFEGLLVEMARSEGAKLIIRGIRAVSDFEYEFQMAGMNSRLCPDVETVFLMASDRCQFISSKLIKEICQLGGNIDQFVSPFVADNLKKKLLS